LPAASNAGQSFSLIIPKGKEYNSLYIFFLATIKNDTWQRKSAHIGDKQRKEKSHKSSKINALINGRQMRRLRVANVDVDGDQDPDPNPNPK